jgi:hypothetical protein
MVLHQKQLGEILIKLVKQLLKELDMLPDVFFQYRYLRFGSEFQDLRYLLERS